MKRYVKVEGYPNLVRDMDNNAILNINKSEVEAARAKRKQRLAERQKVKDVENQITEMKSDILEIKQLLSKLIEKP